MQYAIHKLGYPPEDIVLFAWSIGGYTATWAAMNYPNVRHVVSENVMFMCRLQICLILPFAPTCLPGVSQCIEQSMHCDRFPVDADASIAKQNIDRLLE